MFATELIDKFNALSVEDKTNLTSLTGELDPEKIPYDTWILNPCEDWVKIKGYSLAEAVDQYWEGSFFGLRYFAPKSPPKSSEQDSIVGRSADGHVNGSAENVPTQNIDLITSGDYVYATRYDPLPGRQRKINYGFHHIPVKIPEKTIYFGTITTREVTPEYQINDKLREYLNSSFLVSRNTRMLNLGYNRPRGYMGSKNNYVNIHYTWFDVIHEMHENGFDKEDIDRAWVACEGSRVPEDFGIAMDRVSKQILDASQVVTDMEEIKNLPGYQEGVDARKIESGVLLDIFRKHFKDQALFRTTEFVTNLCGIEKFDEFCFGKNVTLEAYKYNRFCDFRKVIRNLFKRFYSDNSAFDYPTSTVALAHPYDDSDLYSELSDVGYY